MAGTGAELKRITIPGVDIAYAVVLDGREIGIITKYRDDRRTSNPWKAYRGIGFASQMIGAFYTLDGGKLAAISAVVQER